MKIYTDPMLAETVPDGSFGGARPRPRRVVEEQHGPDPDAARHLADLAAEVARIDTSRGYGVNRRYRRPTPETPFTRSARTERRMNAIQPEPPTVHYAADGVTLWLGDSLDVLPTLDDASIDAIVTDPPYELGFMGRAWDASGIAYSVDLWRECWRVLKPGGHLVAFGGTRTYHRLACAIEDAGFEVRDSLHWIYGSGFPKGVDVAKAIDKRRDDRADVLRVTARLAEHRDAAGWTNRRLDELWGFDGMAAHWTTQGKAAAVPTPDQWVKLREVLGFDDPETDALVQQLNARKGLIGEAWEQREVIGERTTGRGTGRGSVAVISDNEANRSVTVPASDNARRWTGWNTALKPAHEPIVLARKSTGINSTVANVLAHGTGALNIDATRTPTGDDTGRRRRTALGIMNDDARQPKEVESEAHPGGRWPTNVVLSHPPLVDEDGEPVGDACADGCVPGCPVAELDAQSGVRTSGKMRAGVERRNRDGWAGPMPTKTGSETYGDTGGASRFFPVFRYESKAPASERPRLPDGTAHPTVKPLALMQWLVRLVTPPSGVVLDPFAGSGTTLEAAVREQFSAIGIERDRPHAELCRVRLDKPLPIALFGEIA